MPPLNLRSKLFFCCPSYNSSQPNCRDTNRLPALRLVQTADLSLRRGAPAGPASPPPVDPGSPSPVADGGLRRHIPERQPEVPVMVTAKVAGIITEAGAPRAAEGRNVVAAAAAAAAQTGKAGRLTISPTLPEIKGTF